INTFKLWKNTSSHILLLLLLFLACFNSSLPYVLKNCTILYQENPSADICLDCAKRKIETVPKDIPKDVVSLKLNNNWLQKINKDDFLGMSKLRTLDLTVNQITDVDQGSFIDLIFLKTLRMGNNKLNYLINNMFQGLSNLTVLLLNNNGIQFIDSRAFQSLINLETLDIGNNRLQQITDIQPILQLPRIRTLGLKCSGFSSFNTRDLQLGLPSNLKELDISGDYLKVFSLTKPIFPYLHRVEFTMCLYYKDLQWDIPEKELLKNISHLYLERPILSDEGITKVLESLDSLRHLRLNALKMRVYEGLLFTVCKIPTLRKLDLFNSNINNLAVQISLCSQLTELDMRKSDIGELPLGSLQSMKQLQSLNMSGNQLIKVPDDIKNLKGNLSDLDAEIFLPIPNLQSLDLSASNISSLDFLMQANLSALKYLKLTENKLLWINETVFKDFPSLTYLDLDKNPFTCDYKQGSFSCLVVLTLLTCFIYNFLRWHLTYTFHLFLAYLYDSRREKKGGPRRFDAFVSYNVHDENWVYKEMLPVLEGEQGWRLCLHHRDFQPGKPIIENITDAIYSSRKTICVISQNYLQSEWCSREIQMASYRLFDEKKDVLILLFLEDIPSRYLSPCYHIRKLVKKHTYLSWPQAAQHPEVFWQNVQRALKTGDTPTENTDLLNGPRQC
uniref:Toll-like receptor 13 n=1 Tax=Cyprinodon variegatus TaxID=28743 RepID=A0A3Q2C8T0_CYPVA